MRAIRRFNNNVVLCIDDNGQEVVAFGKGIGFHELPYEVELSSIEKSYYGIENRYIEMINSLSPEALEVSQKVLDLCRMSLSGDMNPNMLFTLADHIEFAIERYRNDLRVNMPLYYDFENLYPKEFEISKKTFSLIKQVFHVALPDSELFGVGMCILNNEYNSSLNQVNEDSSKLIEASTQIIEAEFGIRIDRSSGNYARYVSHMQYLIKRIVSKKLCIDNNGELYFMLSEQYPKTAVCSDKIGDFLSREKHYKLNQDERLYLMIHINRLCSREECYQ